MQYVSIKPTGGAAAPEETAAGGAASPEETAAGGAAAPEKTANVTHVRVFMAASSEFKIGQWHSFRDSKAPEEPDSSLKMLESDSDTRQTFQDTIFATSWQVVEILRLAHKCGAGGEMTTDTLRKNPFTGLFSFGNTLRNVPPVLKSTLTAEEFEKMKVGLVGGVDEDSMKSIQTLTKWYLQRIPLDLFYNQTDKDFVNIIAEKCLCLTIPSQKNKDMGLPQLSTDFIKQLEHVTKSFVRLVWVGIALLDHARTDTEFIGASRCFRAHCNKVTGERSRLQKYPLKPTPCTGASAADDDEESLSRLLDNPDFQAALWDPKMRQKIHTVLRNPADVEAGIAADMELMALEHRLVAALGPPPEKRRRLEDPM
jgi:hypothetical protein